MYFSPDLGLETQIIWTKIRANFQNHPLFPTPRHEKSSPPKRQKTGPWHYGGSQKLLQISRENDQDNAILKIK